MSWVGFQDACYLNTDISHLRASEDLTVRRQCLLNSQAPSTTVSPCWHLYPTLIPDSTESLQILHLRITHVTHDKKISGWEQSGAGLRANPWVLTCWIISFWGSYVFLRLSIFSNPGKSDFLVYFSQPDHPFMSNIPIRGSFSLNFEILNESFGLGSTERCILVPVIT